MSTKKSAPRLADRYIRHEDFAARIEGVELAPEVWSVFAQLARPRSATELATRLKLDIEAVNAALRRLVRRKLVRKHILSWRDYAPAEPATSPEPSPAPTPAATRSAPPFHALQAAAASAPAPVVSLRIAPAEPIRRVRPVIEIRIQSTNTKTAARPSSPSAPASPAPTAPTAPTATGLRLRPVLDAIGAKAGGGVAGQLLVYRVFLQIPTGLMQAAGIHSLNLVDDHFTLEHPELRAALAETARRHAGVDIEALAAA